MPSVSRQDRHTGVRVRLLGLPSCLLEAPFPHWVQLERGVRDPLDHSTRSAQEKKSNPPSQENNLKRKRKKSKRCNTIQEKLLTDFMNGPVLQFLSTQIYLSPKEQAYVDILMSLPEN